MNSWQRLAARTHGIATLANAATVVGFGLVLWGALEIYRDHYWPGLYFIVIGRLCDLLDGWLAETTKTKSPLGEMLDAAADKFGTLAAVLAYFAAQLAPWWLLIAILAPHLAITIISFVAYRRRAKVHPSLAGKLSMTLTWVCLGAFLLIRASNADHLFLLSAECMALLATALGFYAAFGYTHKQR